LKISRGASQYFEDYVFHFTGYEMTGHEESATDMNINALITVLYNGEEYNLKPGLIITKGQKKIVPAILPDTKRNIYIQEIHIDEDAITIGIERQLAQLTGAQEYLAVEVTEKPLINILWIGTIVMICGLCVQIFYHVQKNRL
jgi:cytochrome c-type biogenesis protein CcmF